MRRLVVTALCLAAGLIGLTAQVRPGTPTIKVSAQPDGAFTVTNTRNQFSKTYRPR